jgi:WD40 repeat protein
MALQFFPITIGQYDHWTTLAVDRESEAVEELLADFGSIPIQWSVAGIRDADMVESRLRAWANEDDPGDTFLYWLGHGSSEGGHAALAHARSPRELDSGGIEPESFYRYLRRRAAAARDCWAIVVFDACGSKRFVELLSSKIYDDEHGPRRFLLVGSADGAATIGRFPRVLKFVLTKTFGAVQKVELGLLGHELRRILGDDSIVVSEIPASAALERSVPPVAGTQVDSADELRTILATLSKDEQRHFIPKAQGGELGEFSWFFEGRQSERIKVSRWLRHSTSGMLVVTGVPGSGKSAFLGDLVMQSRPELRRELLRRGLISLVPPENRPPDHIFDAVIHLTGSTPMQLLHRIADAADLGIPPRDRDAHGQTAWLVSKLRTRQFTLMVDALDEAQQPLTLAENVLRPLSEAHNVRVIVGTRASTLEGPDRPTTDHDILDALGVSSHSPIRLRRDPEAISRYVFRRLVKALGHDEGLEDFSTELGRRDREFLFARLAVREIIENPQLLLDQKALDKLLNCSHGELFTRAMLRFTTVDSVFGVLLTALALAQGRGLPIVHGIWTAVAQSLSDTLEVTDDHIDRLIEVAAPYLILDVENNETVYRLAHRTFVESLTGTPRDADRHLRITQALVKMTEQCKSADEWLPYVSHHLYNHAAAAGPLAWLEVDRLNPRQLALSALRYQFGQLRPEVAGIIGAQHLLLELPPRQRVGTRQLAMTRYGRVIRPTNREDSQLNFWETRWARMRQRPLHLVLEGHSARVTSIVAFPGTDDTTLLASGSHDRTVRIWNLAIGAQQGRLSAGHQVNALTCFFSNDGRTLLASAGEDGTIRILDPIRGTRVGRPLKGHRGPVTAVIALPDSDGRSILVSAGSDRTLRLWEPLSHRSSTQEHRLLGYHDDRINCLAWFEGPRGLLRVASGADDGSVVLWSVATGAPLDTLTGHPGPVTALSVFSNANGHSILCASSEDTTVFWDTTNGSTIGFVADGHTGIILDSVAFVDAAGTSLLATCSADGTARTWDVLSRRSVGQALSGHFGAVCCITEFKQRGHQNVIVTGGEDGTVRAWEPSAIDSKGFEPSISGPITSVRYSNDGQEVAAVDMGEKTIVKCNRLSGALRSRSAFYATFVGSRSQVFLTPDGGSLDIIEGRWHTETRLRKIEGDQERAIAWTVATKWPAVVPVITPRGRTLLTAFSQFDRTILLYDPEIGKYLDFSLPLYGAWTNSATSFASRDGRTMLAIGTQAYEGSAIVYTDLIDTKEAVRFSTGHDEAVSSLTSIGRLLIGGGHSGILWAWDPGTERHVWSLELGVNIRTLDSFGKDICVGTDDGIAVITLGERLASQAMLPDL